MKTCLYTFAIAALCISSEAQVSYLGDGPSAHLGEIFDVIDDLNNDGVPDLLCGFPGDSTQGANAGRVLILSGLGGGVIRTHFGTAAGDRFGSNVAPGGDVDNDGVQDYLIAAVGFSSGRGAAHVYSGSTGSLLYSFPGLVAGGKLGTGISRAGDVNGDGHEDMIVGAPGTTPTGGAHVVSGATGLLLYSTVGTPFFSGVSGYGRDVGHLGDVNGDGVDDLLVGAYPGAFTFDKGYVRVVSGASGTTYTQMSGTSDSHGPLDIVGLGVTSAGDVTGDGVEDFMFGIAYSQGAGAIQLAFGGGGPVPGGRIEINTFGITEPVPFNVGDVTGDGFSELAYYHPQDKTVRLYSWALGQEIQTFSVAQSNVGFGTTIRGIADVTGDGLRDIAIGIPGINGPAGPGAGEIRVFSVSQCAPVSTYCTANANSTGQAASIGAAGTASVSANDFVLTATQCPANKPGLFFYGPTKIATPYADGVLCVGTGAVGYFRVQPATSTSNSGDIAVPIDNTGGIYSSGPGQFAPGVTWNFQFWYRDPQGGPAGFNFSDGLEVTFCP